MRKLLGTAAAAVIALLVVVAGPITSPAAAADGGTEAQFVAAINNIRSQHGLSQLAVHGELVSVARNWADRMAANGAISHNPNLAGQVSANWERIGENVGTGGNVSSLMNAFMASASHRANILEPSYNHIGTGVTWVGDTMYTSHVFMDLAGAGAPPPPPPPPPPAPAPSPAPAPAPRPAPAPAAPSAGAGAATVPAPAAFVLMPPADPVRVVLLLERLRRLGSGVR